MYPKSKPTCRADLDAVARGETVVVCKENEPIAEIRAVAKPNKTPRPIGLAAGTFEVPPSFFDPLPDDLLQAFNGEEPDEKP